MKKEKKSKAKYDAVVLIALPILAGVASWVLPLNYLSSIILFFGLPSIYLSCRKPEIIKRTLVFAATFALIGSIGDYFAVKDGSWHVPTIFSFKLFNVVPMEDIIWFFSVSYLILAYYELFFDHYPHKTVGRRMRYLYTILASIIAILAVAWCMDGGLKTINYFYLKSSIVLAIIPLAAFLFEFPRFLSVFLKITPYFICLFFLTEIVGLHNGYWSFPGRHFIGWVELGGYRFPWEELIFYIVLFGSVTIAYFEIFDDNRLKFKARR